MAGLSRSSKSILRDKSEKPRVGRKWEMPPKYPEPKPTIRKKGSVEQVEVRTGAHELERAHFTWQVYEALAENPSRLLSLSWPLITRE